MLGCVITSACLLQGLPHFILGPNSTHVSDRVDARDWSVLHGLLEYCQLSANSVHLLCIQFIISSQLYH